MSPEMRACVAPAATYAALLHRDRPIGPVRALRRPALAAAVLGGAMALASTRHVTPQLLIDCTILWSWVVVAQALIAWAFVEGPRPSDLGRARALDLFFVSHAPWSLWLLAAAAWAPPSHGRSVTPVLVAGAIPLVLTVRTIAAYFREVLAMDARAAWMRTLAHQTITWGLLCGVWGAAVAIWPRVLERLP